VAGDWGGYHGDLVHSCIVIDCGAALGGTAIQEVHAQIACQKAYTVSELETLDAAAPFGLGATGAAWVFTRSGGVWTQQNNLVNTGAVGA
jgi:hypothetical protein